MKNRGKVWVSFRAATVSERVVTRGWYRIKKWKDHPLAHARRSV
jgi:hypothetical protein